MRHPVVGRALIIAAAWTALLLIGYAAGRIITDAPPIWDSSLLADIQGADHTALTGVMRIATGFGSTLVLDAVFILAMTTLLLRRHWRDALFLLLASPGMVILVQILKRAVNRARPPGHHLAAAQGASWPSGHANSSLALYGGLLLIAFSLPPRDRKFSRQARVAAACLTATLTALIGLSRLYLGVHYPTDVLASWMLAAAWLTVLTLTIQKQAPPAPPQQAQPRWRTRPLGPQSF